MKIMPEMIEAGVEMPTPTTMANEAIKRLKRNLEDPARRELARVLSKDTISARRERDKLLSATAQIRDQQ